MKSQLFLELVELHARQRWLHQECMDMLVMSGEVTPEYAEKSLKICSLEKRESEIIWTLVDLIDLPTN